MIQIPFTHEAEHGREILLADKPEEFAVAVSRLLGDQQLFDAMRRAGRRLVEKKYEWRTIGDEINRIIKEVTHNGEN